MINKVKEIHLLIDTSEVCFEEICTTYVETSRKIKPSHNLEKLLFAGEFEYFK